MDYIFSFEKLEVWEKSRQLVEKIYICSNGFPVEERFGLASQLRRAAVSVPSNLAEGTSRSSIKEKIRFIEIAYGSLMETYCQLIISKDLAYLNKKDFEEIASSINEIARMLNALRSAYLKHCDSKIHVN